MTILSVASHTFWLSVVLLSVTPLSTAGEPTSCAVLDRAECHKSAMCIVSKTERGDYRCRARKGRCEANFNQWGPRAHESCEARVGCKFVPGRCYCPPNV